MSASRPPGRVKAVQAPAPIPGEPASASLQFPFVLSDQLSCCRVNMYRVHRAASRRQGRERRARILPPPRPHANSHVEAQLELPLRRLSATTLPDSGTWSCQWRTRLLLSCLAANKPRSAQQQGRASHQGKASHQGRPSHQGKAPHRGFAPRQGFGSRLRTKARLHTKAKGPAPRRRRAVNSASACASILPAPSPNGNPFPRSLTPDPYPQTPHLETYPKPLNPEP